MNSDREISHLRREYSLNVLDFANMHNNPLEQFKIWFEDAKQSDILEPNVMHLATSINNEPNLRVVLLKDINEKGLVFYTNYESQKGKEIIKNPQVSVNFFWDSLERQVRIKASVEKISVEKSTSYFESRPKKSQIGASISPQSQKIANREVLEKQYQVLEKQYEQTKVLPKPNNWGGFVLIPTYFEFWQGRPSRLHDRLVYSKQGEAWETFRLAP